jgi:spore coat polysaccharide biosynthesis protein SpsF
MKRKVVTIEARMGSSRLPGKVIMEIGEKTVLRRMIERVKRSKLIDDIVVATTTNFLDDEIEEECKKIGVKCFRGSEKDVLSRVLEAAKQYQADLIIELTGDCPLIDPSHIDDAISYYENHDLDYVYNRELLGLPDGFDVQVFSVDLLNSISKLTIDPIDRVHVTWYVRKNPHLFKIGCPPIDEYSPRYWPDLALTLDEMEDFVLIKQIFEYFDLIGRDTFIDLDIYSFLKQYPKLYEASKSIKRKAPSEG